MTLYVFCLLDGEYKDVISKTSSSSYLWRIE